jgi:DHA1 family bicyclomycin/chloramphenicol resistance-like MFS transporter
MRGLASSLQGFIQFALAALESATIAPLLSQSLLTLAVGMAAFTATGFASWSAYHRLNRSYAVSRSKG